MISVAAEAATARADSLAPRFSIDMLAAAVSRTSAGQRFFLKAVVTKPVPSGLVNTRLSPGRAPPLVSNSSGVATPVTLKPYLISVSRTV